MTRETKMGLMLVLVLASVFGFLVYKRAMRPGEVVASKEDTTADETEASDDLPEANAESESFGLDDTNEEPPPMRIVNSARAIPAEDEPDLDDPFNSAAPSTPRLPQAIPDDDAEEEFEPPRTAPSVAVNAGPDPDANDPFQNAGDLPAETEGDPFDGGTDSMPANSVGVVAENEAAAETEEPFALELPAGNAGTTVDVAADAPELGFDEADAVEDQKVVEKQPVVSLEPPVAAETLQTDDEDPFESEPAAEGSTSIQVRSKLPEAPLDFGNTAEPQPLEPDAEFESKELPAVNPAPELMLDDSEEDRYGGYEPIELTSAVSSPAVTEADSLDAPPRRVVVDSEPFATPSPTGTTSPGIAGDKYVIQSGDNFWSISQRKYGTGRFFQALAAHNQSRVPDAAKIKPGVEIALPSADVLESRYATLVPGQGSAEPTAADGAGNANGEFLRGSNGQPMYRVGSGDTLSGIAQKYLGRSRRWEQVLEMNRDVLKDGNTLKLGAVLRLPHDANDVQLSTQPRLFR